MSKHITDANKAKLLAFLRGRAAAGEQSLKTWGKQHRLLSHQAEELADALVGDRLAIKEERASGYVWKALREPEQQREPEPPADIKPPSNEVEKEETTPEPPAEAFSSEVTSSPLAPSPAELLVEELAPAPDPAPHLAIPPPPPEPSAEVEAEERLDQLAQLLLDLPEEAFAAIAAARQELARARELLQRGRVLEEQALADLQAALTGKAPAPREAPSQGQPEGRQAIATWARRPSSAETGEREGTARDKVMRLFLARPEEKLTSAEVGQALKVDAHAVTGPLSTLVRDGKLERITTGLYRLNKAWVQKAA